MYKILVPLSKLLLWAVLVEPYEEPLSILSLSIRYGTPIQQHYWRQSADRRNDTKDMQVYMEVWRLDIKMLICIPYTVWQWGFL